MVVLGILVFIILYKHLNVENDSIFARDFPTWRGAAVFILYIWVLGFNLYCFETYKISHRLIFKFTDHHYSTSAHIFRFAGIFTTLFLILFLIYLLKLTAIITTSLSLQYLVLVVYLPLAIYLFIPLPIFNYKGRLYTLKLVFRCLFAIFLGVDFPIIFMTDQWISLATPLRDVAYTVCYYTRLRL